MTDIVERLRAWPDEPINNVSMLREAADIVERLTEERLAFAMESEERKAEIDRLRSTTEISPVYVQELQADNARLRALYDSATDQAVRYAAEIERLNAVKTAAEKAYRYHMLGYKDPEEFNANVMLDLMNELGELL